MEPFERDNQIEQLDKRRRAVEVVRRFMTRSEEYRKPHLKLVEEARKLYECWKEQSRSQIGRANLALPYAYQIVQTELPQLATAFLKESPPFRLVGRGIEDMQWEEDITDFVGGYQLQQMRFRAKLVSQLEGLCVDGTVVSKVPYVYREAEVVNRVPSLDPVTGQMLMQSQVETEVHFDGPDLEDIPLQDFFPDWAVRMPGDIQAMRGCVHRTFKTLSELKAFEKKQGKDGVVKGWYENLDEVEHSISRKGLAAWSDPYYKSDYAQNDREEEKTKKKPIEIWEYWGLFDPNGDGKLVEYVITIANGDVTIRCDINPHKYRHKPFIACPNVVQKGEFYGLSELFAISHAVKEATALRNARLDNINLGVNRMWKVDRTAGINLKALYSRANGIILTNDMRGIEPIPAPDIPPSAFREGQELSSEIQQSAGSISGPDLTAAGRTFGRSATGASLVSNISSSRISLKVLLLSEMYLKPLVEIMMKYNAQYVTDDQYFRVSSNSQNPNPFTHLPPDAFAGRYDFEVLTSVDVTKDEELSRFNTALPFLQAAESAQPGVIDWESFFGDAGRIIFGRRMQKFTRTTEQVAQLQAQKLAAKQAVNAQVGAGAPQPNAPLRPIKGGGGQ